MSHRRISALLFGGLLALASITATAPSAQAYQSYEECMADVGGQQTWGCYDLKVTPSNGVAATLSLTWTLKTDAEGFNNADWVGGVVLTKWPFEGQWKKYPSFDPVYIPGPHEDCSGDKLVAGNCYKVFTNSEGKLTLTFGPAMAGYVYEIYSHDYICSVDQAGCGPSGGSIDRYIFVFKAFQYKDKNGKLVKTATCPPAKQRKSACVPAAFAKLAATIGGGDPVPLPDNWL